MKFLSKFIFTLLVFTGVQAWSQINKPNLSPRIHTSTHVGLAKIELDYGQPSKQDRPIFGGLIPYNTVWRTGANASTKIKLDTDVEFGGQFLPKGEYALYTIPNKEKWTIILSKNTGLWGSSGYTDKDDFLRIHVPTTHTKDLKETFSIYFEGYHANGGHMIITWENTKVSVPIFVDSDALIFKEIQDKIANSKETITAQTYFDAAQFYYLKNKDLKQAMQWFNKAIELKPQAFWYVYYKAELQFSLKQYKDAKYTVQTCLKAAKNSPYGDFGYIGKCELLLQKLDKK